MIPKAVRKYLESRAEAEAEIAPGVEGVFDHVLVIPAVRESEALFDGVRSAARGAEGRTLVVMVVNEREGADAETVAANRELLEAARRRFETRALGEGAAFGSNDDHDLLLLDRTGSRALRADQGVGTARKIGGDVALALRAAGKVRSEWIHGSDGDAVQPADRFDVAASGETSAVALRFTHEPCGDPELDAAILRYEISLRYRVLGLAAAGSPFAFHTVGSTLAVRAVSYAEVRGMPHRAAGEDFYFLNKLAKVGRIERGSGDPVRLRNRRSDRVPFGTGAALPGIVEDARRGRALRVHDPVVFEVLGAWREGLDRLAESGLDPLEEAVGRLGDREGRALRRAVAPLVPALTDLVEQQPEPGRVAAVHTFFDAFRTLKLLHALRDDGWPDVPWREALDRAAFLEVDASGPPEEIGARLEELESGVPPGGVRAGVPGR